MVNEILAKSEPDKESLIKHTENVLAVWQELKSRYEVILNKDTHFWRRSFISALFHDFGKVAQNFQLVIQDKKKYRKEEYIRHEFLSGILLLYADVKAYEQNPFSLFAVFSHHKPLTDLLFQDEDCFAEIILEKESVEFIYNDFSRKMFENGISKFNPHFDLLGVFLSRAKKDNDGINLYYSSFFKFFSGYKQRSDINQSGRKEYILYKALLNISDWTASAHKSLPSSFLFSKDCLENKIISKLKIEGKIEKNKPFTFSDFQSNSYYQSNNNVIAIAPTGSGKTEAALLWASNKAEYEKIVYLLPTRVTSNAIYKRLIQYFGEDNCAVVHSSAYLFRKEREDEFTKDRYLLDKTFFNNVTVCTIDQVLTQGFNLGYWEIKTFHLLNARIIIDEIHLFEPYTLGLIIATIKYLKKDFRAQFYVMTATMPTKLKTLLQDTLQISEDQIIEDKELLEKSRNTFEIREKTIEDSEAEVSQLIDSFNKVLIVVNTVDAAINLYNIYKERKEKVICFHARFIQKDRQEKENVILEWENTSKPILLIATQVVEVSLDIDYDLLLTENAPMDSIVQRAGRVNRKRKDEKYSKVIVFLHNQVSEENIYKTVPEVLTKTFDELNKRIEQGNGRFTEKELIELVNIVYADFDVTKHSDYLEAIKIYKQIQFENHYIKDVIANENTFTRLGLDTVNVIPNFYYEDLQNKDVIEKSKHEVPVRKYRASGHRNKDGFTYVNYWYDDETGLQFISETKINPTASF